MSPSHPAGGAGVGAAAEARRGAMSASGARRSTAWRRGACSRSARMGVASKLANKHAQMSSGMVLSHLCTCAWQGEYHLGRFWLGQIWPRAQR